MSARGSVILIGGPEAAAVAFLLASCTLTSSDWEPEPLSAGAIEGIEGATLPAPVAGMDAGSIEISTACEGAECQVSSMLPLDATCGDGLLNQDESDIDCGGSCQRACAIGAGCRDDADCESGSYCALETTSCEIPTCTDDVRNGAEVLADCGGGQCKGCPAGTPCASAADCESGVCAGEAGACAAASCEDSVKNQGESDADCGGEDCAPCADGRACAAGTDCQSAICSGGSCAAASCADSVKNQDETGADCGGENCAPCGAGLECASAADCASRVCVASGCAPGVARCCQPPSCSDDVANGTEPFIDCGDASCGGCPVGNACVLNQNCATGLCEAGVCTAPPTCSDEIQNGAETDVDCGGGNCPRCSDLSDCDEDTDCFNNNCDASGVCISCGDATINGTETDVDCGGADPACQRCPAGSLCTSNADCATTFCLAGVC